MTVVTIARQLGARGEAVGNRLAEALGWKLLDRALVERIAEELEVAPEQVEATNERVEGFVERLGLYLSEGFPEALPVPAVPTISPETTARAARRIVAAAAEEGTAVIVGHGAQCVLEGHPDTLPVLLYAPLEVRVARVREHFVLGEKEALEKVRRSDADRKRYIREHFGRDWLDPALYHLCIDTGRFGVEGAAELIWEAVTQVFPLESHGGHGGHGGMKGSG
ncbi:MAG TPA: cytidylate kinase-like family protein [Longimicrobiaceae bacterium]|nr:cytidylate kinase-like family protein [Longimicrobiaceae bacterium]